MNDDYYMASLIQEAHFGLCALEPVVYSFIFEVDFVYNTLSTSWANSDMLTFGVKTSGPLTTEASSCNIFVVLLVVCIVERCTFHNCSQGIVGCEVAVYKNEACNYWSPTRGMFGMAH